MTEGPNQETPDTCPEHVYNRFNHAMLLALDVGRHQAFCQISWRGRDGDKHDQGSV